MPLFRRPSCVRRCASYSQTVNSTGDAPVCGAYVRLKLGTGDQFRPSRENSRTKLQDVVTDSRAKPIRSDLIGSLSIWIRYLNRSEVCGPATFSLGPKPIYERSQHEHCQPVATSYESPKDTRA